MKKALNYLPLIGGLLGIIAIFLFFAPFVYASETATGLGITITSTLSVSGFVAAFGGQGVITATGLNPVNFDSSLAVMALLSFIFVLIGVIAGVLVGILKSLPAKKIIALAAGVLLLLGGIFAFCSCSSWVSANVDSGFDASSIKLGAGAIIAGILAILGGLCVGAKALVKE